MNVADSGSCMSVELAGGQGRGEGFSSPDWSVLSEQIRPFLDFPVG